MSDLEASLRLALPAEHQRAIAPLTQLLSAVLSSQLDPATAQATIAADEGLKAALRARQGQRLVVSGKVLSFEGSQTGDVSIGAVAGRG